MRKNILLGMAVGAVLVLGSAGGAFAGEVGGHGQDTHGPANSNSPCAFSGLQDEPFQPGTVQNWGHTKDVEGVVSTRGASSALTPEGVWGCNGHTYSMKH